MTTWLTYGNGSLFLRANPGEDGVDGSGGDGYSGGGADYNGIGPGPGGRGGQDGGDGGDSSYNGGTGSGVDLSSIPLQNVVIR